MASPISRSERLLLAPSESDAKLSSSLGVNDNELHNSDKRRTYGTSQRCDIVLDATPAETGGYMRYVMVLLCFFGICTSFGASNVMVVAVVAMVNTTSSSAPVNDTIGPSTCPIVEQFNASKIHEQKHGSFNWNFGQQSLVLGISFFGSILTHLPSGILAERVGGKLVFGLSVFVSSILTMTIPLVAEWGVNWVIALRFFVGMFMGIKLPAHSCLWGRWAPPLERSKLLTLANSGMMVAMVVSPVLTGYLTTLEFLGGWPLPFYLFGGLGCVWFLFWIVLASNSPSDNRWISSSEKFYIESTLGQTENTVTSYNIAPWKSIVTSVPVIALTLTQVLIFIGNIAVNLNLPVYISQVLNFNMTINGILLSLINVGTVIGSIFSAWLCDKVLKKNWLSVTNTRKMFALAGCTMHVLFLVGMGFVVCDPVLSVLFLALSWFLGSLNAVGANISLVDIAPQYAGSVLSLSITVVNVGGLLAQWLSSLIINGRGDPRQWQNLFLMSAGFTAASALVYLIFGTSERQEWAIPKEESSTLTVEDEKKPLVDHNANIS